MTLNPHLEKLGGRETFVYPGGMPFEIISPAERLLSEPVDSAEIPGAEGYFGVLPHHTPMIVNLRPGIITLTRGGDVAWRIYVSGGICEVMMDRVTVLAERAYDLPQLKLADAEKDIADLTEALKKPHDEISAAKLSADLSEAEFRRDAILSQHKKAA